MTQPNQEAPSPLPVAEADDERLGVAVAGYLDRLRSANSKRAGRQALSRGLRLMGCEAPDQVEAVAWWELRKDHVVHLRRALMESDYSHATASLTLSAVRGVAECAFRAGQLTEEGYRGVSSVKSPAVTELVAGWVLSPAEVSSLFAVCRADTEAGRPNGPRDGALLGMLCAGLKREEVAGLTLGDVDPSTGHVTFVDSGGRNRAVWLAEGANEALCDWLEWRGSTPGPLWSRIRKGGHLALPATGLSGQSVFILCRRRGRQAGLPRPLTPVVLRRTFISRLLGAGAAPETVQQLVGHRSVATTERYAPERESEVRSDVAKLFDVDY